SDSQNAAACSAWSSCAAGTYVTNTPSTTTDRSCAPCGDGSSSSSPTQTSCVPYDACPAGTEMTQAGSDTAPPVCSACEAGTYCAGDAAAKQPCAAGTWDHDGDAATACVGHTDCMAGQYVAEAGTALDD